MCFVFSFLPATFWAVVGYFVLFSSTRAEGGVRKLGQVLAVWLFVLASLFPLMGAYVTLSGLCPIGPVIQQLNTP